jgi:hypothetical protein
VRNSAFGIRIFKKVKQKELTVTAGREKENMLGKVLS